MGCLDLYADINIGGSCAVDEDGLHRNGQGRVTRKRVGVTILDMRKREGGVGF